MQSNVRCLLCGARMSPPELVSACTELVNTELAVLGARCPHCQGYFEVLPVDGRLDLGYCAERSRRCFDVAQSVPFDGLLVLRQESPPILVLTESDRRWEFRIVPED